MRGSKVSMKKNSKNLNIVENFVKRFESFCLRLSTVIERIFYNFLGEIQVWSDYLLIF